MAILLSGLETLEYGTQGADAILTSNMQLLDNKLINILTALTIPGQESQSNNVGSTIAPQIQQSTILVNNSGGAPGSTIQSVSGSGDDATINNNNARLVAQINNMIGEITDIHHRLIELKAFCESLQVSCNTLFTKLRKTTGNGI